MITVKGKYMAKKLYVGNLSYDVTEDELSQLFGRCGRVVGIRIVRDRGNGKSKGFGFVEMADADEASEAIESMMGQDLKGRPLVVSEARAARRGRGGSILDGSSSKKRFS